MALFLHDFRRFTQDAQILVTKDGLKRIHQELNGRGHLPLFERGNCQSLLSQGKTRSTDYRGNETMIEDSSLVSLR